MNVRLNEQQSVLGFFSLATSPASSTDHLPFIFSPPQLSRDCLLITLFNAGHAEGDLRLALRPRAAQASLPLCPLESSRLERF